MNPLISVLMPVREPDSYLGDAIDSILQQTIDDFELLLITYPGAETWSDQLPIDSRIKVVQRQAPGIVSALNTGLKLARGHYIARMDADDLSLPDRFEQQLRFLRSYPTVAIVGARVKIFTTATEPGAGNQAYQHWLNSLYLPRDIQNSLFVESPIPHPSLFASKSVFDSLNGYSECAWAEDYDLLLRAGLAGFSMGKPASILLHWRDHGSRLTRTDERYSRLNFTRAKAWALSRSLAHNRSVIICGTGRNAVRLCDALREFDTKVEAFVEQDEAPTRTSRRNLPVMTYAELPQRKNDSLLVSAVTAYGAREKLRSWFAAQGWTELSDFVIAG